MIRPFGLAALALALASCGSASAEDDPSNDRISELEGQLANAREKAEELAVAVDEVENARSDLDLSISRFEDEDWKDAVPAVRDSASEIEDATTALTLQATELTEALED